jgi:predicted Zn-dependent protease
MADKDVASDHQRAVLYGITAVMNHARAPEYIPINDLGVWRSPDWIVNGTRLSEWNSVDWYIGVSREQSRDQLNGGTLLRLLYTEPWQEADPHYDIVVTSHDLYDDGCDFCVGLAVHGFGAVISTHRFRGLSQKDAYNCIVTETMHEVGHVFGLVPETRTMNVEYSLGMHCTNRCIMRQGLRVPSDWQAITADRLRGYEFCSECSRDLQRYFA